MQEAKRQTAVLLGRTAAVASSHKRRANGDGSIYETGDGRLRGSLTLTHPISGKRVRRVVSGRTRAEVARKLGDMRRDASGALPSRETTGAYLNRWLTIDRARIRPSTARQRAQYVRSYIIPALGHIPLSKLAPADVERMTSQLVASGKSPRTAAHARTILRRALADAERDALILRNVAALARPPRVEAREMRALTAAEVRILLAATEDDRFGQLFAFAVGSGLRLGEVAGLRWQDVDLEGGTITVRRAMAEDAAGGWSLSELKTRGSRRTLTLPAIALGALRRQKACQAVERLAAGDTWQDVAGLVFTDEIGRPLLPTTVSRAFRQVVRRLELPVRFHDLRHTYASVALGAGAPLKAVSEALGHSTITLTADTYAPVTVQTRRDAADAVDRALG
jgi:integrase